MPTKIPIGTLHQLVRLSKRKEALMAQIQEIDRKIVRLQSRSGDSAGGVDNPAPVTISRAPPKASRSPRNRN